MRAEESETVTIKWTKDGINLTRGDSTLNQVTTFSLVSSETTKLVISTTSIDDPIVVSRNELLKFVESALMAQDAEYGESRSFRDITLRQEYAPVYEQFGLSHEEVSK